MVGSIVLDFSAAFDIIFTQKLVGYGFDNSAPTQFNSYLTGRTQTDIYISCYCEELNTVLQTELDDVAEWINKNKLALNISKTLNKVIGSHHSVNPNPLLHLKIQDNKKLSGTTADNQRLWSKQIHCMGAKMGWVISMIKIRTFLDK